MPVNSPALFELWQKRQKLRRRVFLVLFVVAGLSYWLAPHILPQKGTLLSEQNSPKTATATSGSLPKGTPDYVTLTPAKKSVDWTRVSPPDHNPVYAYSDTVAGVSITVSQQPLPNEFTRDTATQLEELAKSYGASRFITVNGAKVFVGTSAKGPQSLIFTKNSLLILMKSSTALNDSQWSEYIEALR